ncbi:MAG: 6-phosphofructokinase, partial [Acidobacteriia bacterium]|nr:6-phosphofructokinase [Terriglobia bacterium]
KLVASTFAGMAVDCIQDNKCGIMTSIVNGCYALSPIPDPKLGPRKVDVETMYNTARYRPNYDHKLGLPIFLTKA